VTARSRRPNPFRGGDPVGHPTETDEPDGETHSPHRLAVYHPDESGIPRYVGPAPRHAGRVRRSLGWLSRLFGGK
jgi:hypothetical protein